MKLGTVSRLLFLVVAGTLPSSAFAGPEPAVSGALSIVPGLGQVANGDTAEGIGWFVGSLGLFFSGNHYLGQMGFDLWLYNTYDAYKDAGGAHTQPLTAGENWLGAFNPVNVIDPIGAPIVAVGAVSGIPHRSYPALRNPAKIATYSVVGLGEEGLFRGFLFPGFSDVFGSKLVGGALSSIAFAYAHALGGSENLRPSALISRFVLGALFCFQANLNDYDLRKNIFAHTWFDILVDENAHQIGLKVGLPF